MGDTKCYDAEGLPSEAAADLLEKHPERVLPEIARIQKGRGDLSHDQASVLADYDGLLFIAKELSREILELRMFKRKIELIQQHLLEMPNAALSVILDELRPCCGQSPCPHGIRCTTRE